MKTLLVDNYDSFTWNLYEYLSKIGCDVLVLRNDKFTLEELRNYSLKNIVISPGPGTPQSDSGLSKEVIKEYEGKIPILGVCLGLQCIIEYYGGKLDLIPEVIHGKTSEISHDGIGIFKNVVNPCLMTRYHSLASNKSDFPSCLSISATSPDGVIQAIRHKELCIMGVQFHPESVLSGEGMKILKNFADLTFGKWDQDIFKGVEKVSINETSILNKIVNKRVDDIESLKNCIGKTFKDLNAIYEMNLLPPPLNLYERLVNDSKVSFAVMARFVLFPRSF